MKKYLFLTEKSSIAKLLEKVYNKNKGELTFEATFVSLNSSCWSRFDKIRILNDYFDMKIVDVNNLDIPCEFYILGYERLKKVANEIDLNEYDEIVFAVNTNIYGAILINEFVKLKNINISSFKAIKFLSLEENDILESFRFIIDCDKFIKELVAEFKNDLYVVTKNIFIFDKTLRITLYKDDLVLFINRGDSYFLCSNQFSKEIKKEKLEEVNIFSSLVQY